MGEPTQRMIRLLLLSLFIGLSYAGLGTIQRISTLTSVCEDCDMTLLGQVNVKGCGGLPERCCSVVIGDFEGKYELEDCFNYNPADVPSPGDLKVVVYHEGSDGGQLDWIEVATESEVSRCYLGVWMDSFSSVTAQCQRLQ